MIISDTFYFKVSQICVFCPTFGEQILVCQIKFFSLLYFLKFLDFFEPLNFAPPFAPPKSEVYWNFHYQQINIISNHIIKELCFSNFWYVLKWCLMILYICLYPSLSANKGVNQQVMPFTPFRSPEKTLHAQCQCFWVGHFINRFSLYALQNRKTMECLPFPIGNIIFVWDGATMQSIVYN